MRAADQSPDEGRCQIVIIGVDPRQACWNSFASNFCCPGFATVEFALYADTAEDNSLSSVERVRSISSARGATKVLVRFVAASYLYVEISSLGCSEYGLSLTF
jgi:hypothetical protein